MRKRLVLMAGVLAVLAVSGCQSKPEPKASPRVSTIAPQVTPGVSESVVLVTNSRYRTYRWMTTEEMVRNRIGYDPTMSASTRTAVEEAIDDNLSEKGYREAGPAAFVVAFNNVYLDRNRQAPGWGLDGAPADGTDSNDQSTVVVISDMEMYRSPEEGFTVLFFDAQTHRLLWRGSGVEGLSGGEQSADKITGAVYQALDAMPVPLAP